MSKRKNEIFNSLNNLRKERQYISDSIGLLHNKISLESKTIRILKEQDKNLSCLEELYGNTEQGKLDQIDENEYSQVLFPLSTAISFEPMYRSLKEDVEKQFNDISQYNNVLISATPVTYTAKGTASVIVKSGSLVFTDGENIIKKYDDKLDLEKDIEYIRNYLNANFSDIIDDFNHFTSLYHAFETSPSSYQEIIGLRSMIFFKLIFPFVKTKYGFDKPRKDAIIKFVFGTNTFLSTTQPIIDNAHNLYKELSEQDDTRPSAKLGNVTKQYAEDLVIKAIGALASLLRLRDKYFKA